MNKKVVTLIVILGLILAGTSYTSFLYFQTKEWEDKVYTGISVMDKVDLSGLTKDEAKEKLVSVLENTMLEKEVVVSIDGEEKSISYEELKATYDIDSTVESALEYGKDKPFLQKYRMLKKDNNIDLELKLSYDEKILDQFIKEMKEEYDREAVDSTIEIVEPGKFNVTKEQIGRSLQYDELKKTIVESIESDNQGEEVHIEAPITTFEPKVREATLKGIDTKIAESKTAYKTSGESRSYNVKLATDYMNGTLVMPGERFSFNDVVGNRSEDRGFRVSKVIVNNTLVDGVGGGVCQVSTTLYHSVMKTGLMFYERLNHSLPSSYSELGQDATVAWGSIDYKFTNTFDYPIFIEGYTKNKEVFVNIYSNASVKQGKYVMVSEIEKVIEPEIVEIEDPNMYVGEKEVTKSGKKGYIVNVYREHIVDGKVVENKFISRDTYQVVNGEVKIGIKEKTEE